MLFRHFFYMNKADRQTVVALLSVGLLLVLLIGLLDGTEEAETAKMNDSIAKDTLVPTPVMAYDATPTRQPERFAFDPNTADSIQLLRLGLSPHQVRSIYRYRARGGIYQHKEDFARLYGLTAKQYRELEPYIRISPDYLPAAMLVREVEKPLRRDTLHKLQEGMTIDLATADTSLLRRVPGIGSYYARRIADYGRRLGGYVSVDQLDEIDDFPQEAKQYFVIEDAQPLRLSLNRLSLNELKRHPYINYYQARAIVEYRRLHGSLTSLEDLRLLRDFRPEDLDRLAPYVEF